ncbi:hypothetical protein [Streptomyces microflavus]|uniref:hypothetical protein n=1 Tax=Streptomyces microflavus TaxID=1919 RepID=UPI0036E190B9
MKSARITGLTLRFQPASGTCAKGPYMEEAEIDCTVEAFPRRRLAQVADGEWRNFAWTDMSVMGLRSSAVRRRSVCSDSPCPTPWNPIDSSRFPCVPVKVKVPEEPRG